MRSLINWLACLAFLVLVGCGGAGLSVGAGPGGDFSPGDGGAGDGSGTAQTAENNALNVVLDVAPLNARLIRPEAVVPYLGQNGVEYRPSGEVVVDLERKTVTYTFLRVPRGDYEHHLFISWTPDEEGAEPLGKAEVWPITVGADGVITLPPHTVNP